MATKMHRLQISLPRWQAQFLAARARRDGVSIAAVVRRLVEREASRGEAATDGLWEIAGIADDPGPTIDGIAVSENPEMYLSGATPKRKRDS